ncbi:ATP-dependent helicase [Rubritalea profundi]|uniref:DNA 3'-5' helicase n=1 Tax=Rubritalea profundi TaxID=1658618 RepID=A0A2S7U4L0_9BACT|nr:UvrD-helicase domain-containing protein [Rubritalea profundi]PQJ29948.1 DNA helicase UvrD [Rubritalea profundi]
MSTGFSLSSLNEAQREAVNSLDGPVLILAGAGTGKTRTVTCRIANMLQQGVLPENILAVTFTNKSAVEMKERVCGMVSKAAGEVITVCTFHSLCVRILREGIEKLGYKKNFTIYSGQDQIGMIKQLIIRKGGKDINLDANQVISLISNNKNAGIPAHDQADELVGAIALAYNNELRAQNAVDFDDLLLLAEKLLREHSDVREVIRKKYTHVTVDEFQDTNGLQVKLLKQLVGVPYNVCVVGDDDQSIYGWRGADVTNILQFERIFPDPKVILLEVNYRSSAAVLKTANSLIKHNLGRREKELKPFKPGGKPLRLITMPGDEEEAEFIAEEMHERNATQKTPWEDFAILFRTNAQSRNLEVAMRDMKIPYRVVGSQSFFDRKEVRDCIAYLQVLNSPISDVPLLRILNAPPRGIGQASALLITEASRERECSIWEAMGVEEVLSQLSTKVRNSVNAFVELILKYHERFASGEECMGTLFHEFIEEVGYEDWMRRHCKTENEKKQRGEGLNDLRSDLAHATSKKRTLQKFLDHMALQSDKDDDIEKQKGVCMITLHASKGLEFPLVYLVGLENGILPHKRSLEEGTIDEERRLLYVGITRAQDEFTMTYCAWRTKYGDRTSCEPSVFLKELSFDDIIEEDYDDIMGAEATEEETESFFDGLKSLLE